MIIAEYAEARKLNYFSEYQDHKDMEEDVAKQRIQEKIFDANVYVSLYKHDKSRGPELYRLAKFCSIDEKVLKGFIQRGDKDFYENHLLEEIGYDTDIEKLKEIKCEIFELKANNYGYCIGIEGTEKLTKLHRKIDELIMENDAKERQNLVKETFVNNKRGGAIKKLLEMSDERIHWLLFRDMITRFKKGVEISQYKGEQYPLIIEAYWLGALYGEQRSKIIEMVKKNLRVWSPYACASLALAEENGFKGYKYKQENKAFHVWEGAKKRSAHAWWYLGLQHKNEKINTEENLQLARIYLKNANIYGIGDKRVLEILK